MDHLKYFLEAPASVLIFLIILGFAIGFSVATTRVMLSMDHKIQATQAMCGGVK